MDKFKNYIVGILIASFGLVPPVKFVISQPSEFWPWYVILAGFAGFYTIFLKTDWIIKVVAVGGFFNCFFSSVPFMSFTVYIQLIACCYFYILCRSIKDHTIVFNFLQCLLILNAVMFTLQLLSKDVLFNFTQQLCFGVVGQYMQSASFSVILSAVLIQKNIGYIGFPLYCSWFCNSAGAFMSLCFGSLAFFKKKFLWIPVLMFIGFALWMWFDGKFQENINLQTGRLGTWIKLIKLWWQRPWQGWGIGTFKGVYPALAGYTNVAWKTAHNDFLQILFETGLFGLSIVIIYVSQLFYWLIKLRKRLCMVGVLMIGANMMVHFPGRMIQCVLIITYFLAYIQGRIKNGFDATCNSEPCPGEDRFSSDYIFNTDG